MENLTNPAHMETKDFLKLLTPRQQDCVNLLLAGGSSKEIAKQLALSHRTVDTYIDTLKKKFNAKNRIHLVAILRGSL